MDRIVDRLIELLRTKGARQYGGERVSQCEHALQSASLAAEEDAPGPLIVAALLHDIGHLLHDEGEQPAARGIDDRHEEIGAEYLLPAFGPAVAEPVRLHVPAKRYLCATDPGHFARLSPGSVRSLALQGGPFSPEEAAGFRALPFAEDAIRIRRWDEAAKVPGIPTPDLERYRATLQAALRT
ncbi:MAG TPA: HD domain-containing protein [Stellaceae bacterium]|jgi:[1-hydroxy-2-(trimethylamino)ethyl]phosphonate dioxygenase|nr:HD domain-containing protein [Stellaceae bacterium]